MSSVYALNLFDLADNEDYLRYSRSSRDAVTSHGGRVIALGRLIDSIETSPGVDPRRVMILVEWTSQETFDSFLNDPALGELHELRASGTANYLWWSFEHLPDLRPLFGPQPSS